MIENEALGIERTFILRKAYEEINRGVVGEPILVAFKDNMTKKFNKDNLYLYAYDAFGLPHLTPGDLVLVPAIKHDNYEVVKVIATYTDMLNDERLFNKALYSMEKTKEKGLTVRPVITNIQQSISDHHRRLQIIKEKFIKIESLKREIEKTITLDKVKHFANYNPNIKEIMDEFNEDELFNLLGGNFDVK